MYLEDLVQVLNIMEKFYESPIVEVIEVEVEKGFATSDGGTTPDYDI